jgi:anti-anti-sigma regulatory factor
MYKITQEKNGGVSFVISGHMDSETVAELKKLFSAEAEGRRIVLDLNELTLVDEDAVRFLAGCETNGIELRNCPAYVREWITREQGS